MGAISTSSSIHILREYLSDHERTVRETCEIAIAKIEWDHSEEGQKQLRNLDEAQAPYAHPVNLIDKADVVAVSIRPLILLPQPQVF